MMCNISCSPITKNVKFLRIFHGRKGNHLPEESLLSSPWKGSVCSYRQRW